MTGSVAITRTQSHDCMSAWTFEQTFTHKDHTSSLYNWSPRDIKWKQQPIRDTGKNLNFYAGRDWGQEEKGTTEDEMAGWHHWLDGCESQWTPGVGDGQGGLVCCYSWGCKELDMTEWLIWSESYNILMSKIEEYANKWKDIPFLWVERTNIVKMSILPNALYRFNATFIKIIMAYFIEREKSILKWT